MTHVNDLDKIEVRGEVGELVDSLKEKIIQISCFGTRKTCSRVTKTEKSLLIFCTVAMLVTICLSMERLIIINDPNNPVYTFSVLILISALFCVAYMPIGVFYQRFPELLVVLIGFGTTAVIFTIDMIKRKDTHTLYWVRFGLFCVCFGLVVPLALKHTFEYVKNNDLPFRAAAGNGAPTGNRDAQQHFLMRSIFRSLLLIDLQISVTVIPLFWPEGEHFDPVTRYLVIPVAIGEVVMLISGLCFARSDSKRCRVKVTLGLYLFFWMVVLVCVGFLLIKTIIHLRSKDSHMAQDGIYIIATVISAISLVMRLLTALIVCKVWRGLGKDFHQIAREASIINYQSFSETDVPVIDGENVPRDQEDTVFT